MVEIVKRGVPEMRVKVYRVGCEDCGCEFTFAASDAKYVTPDGIAFIACPHCGATVIQDVQGGGK